MNGVRISRGMKLKIGQGIFTIFLGLPFVAGGLLIWWSVLNAAGPALLSGQYGAEPALLGQHLFVLFCGYLFLGAGLLMIGGGIYTRIDTERRRVTAFNFYGYVGWVRHCEFDEVVQVVQRTTNSRPASQHMRRHDGIRRYYSTYKLELELTDGRRMAIGSHGDKARIEAQAERVASQLGVPLRNLGLIGHPYERTK